jgi:hypothetical protein
MRHTSRWILACAVLLAARPAQAKLVLTWDFPRDFTPQPVFLITIVAQGGGTQTLTVPYTAPGTCAVIPGATQESFCAEVACPVPGIYQFTAYAYWPETQVQSGPSNTLTEQSVAMAGSCALVAVEIPPATPPPPSTPPPPPCNKPASQPHYLPAPTTTTAPAPVEITVEAAPVQTTPAPAPPPRPSAQVLRVAPTIVARVAPQPVIRPGTSGPVARATVSAGPPTDVPLQQPEGALPPLPPCP